MTRLITPRLVLRPARTEDLGALYAVLSDPSATEFWSTPPHESLDQTRAWMADMFEPGPDRADFVVEFEGQVIGKAGFWRLPEIGYILAPAVWRRGLATEALAAVIQFVLGRAPDLELTADVDPRNTASIRLLERLGFHKTGSAERTFEIGGVWVDSLYFALKGVDWTGRRLIRTAGPEDAAALLPLIEGAYRGEGSRRGWTTEADLLGGQRTDRAGLEEILANPSQSILMAFDGGDLIGSVLIADRGGTGYLGMLAVDPARQAGGVGKALVQAAERELAGRFGLNRVEMQVFWQRAELIGWYERMGYCRTGETRPFPMDNPRMGLPLRDDLWFEVLAKDLSGGAS